MDAMKPPRYDWYVFLKGRERHVEVLAEKWEICAPNDSRYKFTTTGEESTAANFAIEEVQAIVRGPKEPGNG